MKRRVACLASLVVPALVLAGCHEDMPPSDAVRPVFSMMVKPSAAAYSAVGTVEPRYRTDLGFRVLGRLIARPVEVGDQVVKGQIVATIDPTALRLAVESAKAALAKAEAQLANAQYTEERKRTLLATETVAKQAFDDAQQIRAGAEASVASARANLAKAVEQLGYAQVRAEFAGVVTAVGTEVGQVVAPGQTVITVARPDVREAVIDLGADFPVPVGAGLPFTICHELRPDLCVEGRVREIAPEADPITRTRRVRITMDDPPESFRLGSTVRATVADPSATALRVPGSAILTNEQGTFVWLIDAPSGTVSLHKVAIETDAAGVRVTDGLAPGMRIVTAGVHSLKPDQKVRVEGDRAP